MPSDAPPPLPILQTDRLALRRLTLHDAAFILDLLNEPSFLENIGDRGVRTPDDARRYLETGPLDSYARHGFGLFMTERKADGVAMGICGLLKRPALDDVDVGFALRPAFWGRGYATEAAAAVMEYGRNEFGLTRIVAVTAPHNGASVKVLEKLGLRFERMVRLTDDADEIFLYA